MIAELKKDIDAGGKQQELLDETLKLLKKQLEAALCKEAAAVGKAETMQKVFPANVSLVRFCSRMLLILSFVSVWVGE